MYFTRRSSLSSRIFVVSPIFIFITGYTAISLATPHIPVETPPKSLTGEIDYARVTTSILNVRSGPDLEKPIIDHIREGDVLEIQVVSPEWYYVKLQNDTAGRIMMKYTIKLPPQPVG